jgi:F-type H+-transporting ATPase subunit epsilon
MKLEITTPERLLVSTDVDSVQLPGKNGYLGVLPQHAPLISELAPGTIQYTAAGRTEKFAVSAGYAEVLPQKVSVLAEAAEKAEEIDVPRAQAAKKRAEERMRAGRDIDLERAMWSLRRAMARIETAGK